MSPQDINLLMGAGAGATRQQAVASSARANLMEIMEQRQRANVLLSQLDSPSASPITRGPPGLEQMDVEQQLFNPMTDSPVQMIPGSPSQMSTGSLKRRQETH